MSKEKFGKKKVVVIIDSKSIVKKVVKLMSFCCSIWEVEFFQMELVFGKFNYIFIVGGLGFVFFGLILMVGGDMFFLDVWEDDIIYSVCCIVFVFIVILMGLGMEIWVIFKKQLIVNFFCFMGRKFNYV